MKTLFAFSAAMGLALAAAPAAAQSTSAEMRMSAPQQSMYDAWPADRQAAYDAWPANAKTYFWTLNEQQRTGWWVLNDEQRLRVVAMTPEQRTAAWTSIMNQMSGANAAATAGASTTTGTAGMASTTSTAARSGTMSGTAPRFVSRAVVQTTPSGYTATANGTELPTCRAGQQDGCINSWEKNRTGTRPLDRWPGRPASEMD